MNIAILANADYANAGHYLAAALRSVGHFSVCVTRIPSLAFNFPHECRVTYKNAPAVDRVVKAADVVITKDDRIAPERLNFKPNPQAVRVATVEGLEFRLYRENVLRPVLDTVAAVVAIHADVAFPEVSEFIPSAFPMGRPTWKPRRRITIAHSPSNRKVKGTDDVFLPAIDILTRRGYHFDVDLITGAAFHECLARKAESTIFFDQAKAGFGTYGFAGIEAMAFGVPLVTYLSEQSIRQSDGLLDPATCPIQNVDPTPESLAACLERFIRDPDVLEELSDRTSAWVRDVHSFASVAKRWQDLLWGLIG